jgi:hypothetical protein
MAYDLIIGRYGALAAAAAWSSRQNEMYSGEELVERPNARAKGYKAGPPPQCPDRYDHGGVDLVSALPAGSVIDDHVSFSASPTLYVGGHCRGV